MIPITVPTRPDQRAGGGGGGRPGISGPTHGNRWLSRKWCAGPNGGGTGNSNAPLVIIWRRRWRVITNRVDQGQGIVLVVF